jgi:hypothetical protein
MNAGKGAVSHDDRIWDAWHAPNLRQKAPSRWATQSRHNENIGCCVNQVMSFPNNLYKECFVTSGGVCREPPQTSPHAILNTSYSGHLYSYDGLRRLCRPNNNLHDLLRHTQKRTMPSLIALNSPNLHPLPRSSQSSPSAPPLEVLA